MSVTALRRMMQVAHGRSQVDPMGGRLGRPSMDPHRPRSFEVSMDSAMHASHRDDHRLDAIAGFSCDTCAPFGATALGPALPPYFFTYSS